MAERSGSRIGWFVTFVILAAVAGICVAGYVFYKYRLRVCFFLFTLVLLLTNPKNSSFVIKNISNDISDFCVSKSKMQSYMDSEIMAIMSQYMPLESQNTTDPMTGESQQQQLRLTSAA